MGLPLTRCLEPSRCWWDGVYNLLETALVWTDSPERERDTYACIVAALFLPGVAHPLFLPGGTYSLFLTGRREKQQGEEGEKSEGGGHPLLVPGLGDEQEGKGEGRKEMEWGRGLPPGQG